MCLYLIEKPIQKDRKEKLMVYYWIIHLHILNIVDLPYLSLKASIAFLNFPFRTQAPCKQESHLFTPESLTSRTASNAHLVLKICWH